MADPIRVLFKFHSGFPTRRASDEEREQSYQLMFQVFEKWKKDPGIRYKYYYLRRGVSHCCLFEVDDLSKVAEMDNDVFASKDLLLEKFSFEVVFANNTVADFWES